MTLELETIPCLADNYAFLVHDRKSGATALFDAPETWPIQRELEKHDWQLTHIFLTHHHADHIDGVEELMVIGGAEIYAAALPRAQRLYLTEVHADVAGDAVLPAVDWSEWREISRERHAAVPPNPYDYSFVLLERRESG